MNDISVEIEKSDSILCNILDFFMKMKNFHTTIKITKKKLFLGYFIDEINKNLLPIYDF